MGGDGFSKRTDSTPRQMDVETGTSSESKTEDARKAPWYPLVTFG